MQVSQGATQDQAGWATQAKTFKFKPDLKKFIVLSWKSLLNRADSAQLLASDWLAELDPRWRVQDAKGQTSRYDFSSAKVARGLPFLFLGSHGQRRYCRGWSF